MVLDICECLVITLEPDVSMLKDLLIDVRQELNLFHQCHSQQRFLTTVGIHVWDLGIHLKTKMVVAGDSMLVLSHLSDEVLKIFAVLNVGIV